MLDCKWEHKIKKSEKTLFIFFAILILGLNVLTLVQPFSSWISRNVLYSVELVTFVLAILAQPTIKINRTLTLFCVVCAMSIIINNPPEQFHSSLRLFFFIIMLGLLSPLVENGLLTRFRNVLWPATMICISIGIIVSAVLYIPWVIQSENGMGYKGLFGHPMSLGIMAAIATVYSLTQLLFRSTNKQTNKWLYLFFWITLIVGTGMLLIAGSRAAMLGTFASLLTIGWYLRQFPRKLGFVIAGVAVIVVICCVSPNTFLRTAKYKFSIALSHNSWTFSRDELWQARLDEFKDSPIIGVGFASSTHYSQYWDYPRYLRDLETAKCTNLSTLDTSSSPVVISEPSSSWLSVLSNTGILGITVILLFNLQLVTPLIRRSMEFAPTASIEQFLPIVSGLVLWVLLVVHGIFEGWILYSGSLTAFIYWLLTSKLFNLR